MLMMLMRLYSVVVVLLSMFVGIELNILLILGENVSRIVNSLVI